MAERGNLLPHHQLPSPGDQSPGIPHRCLASSARHEHHPDRGTLARAVETGLPRRSLTAERPPPSSHAHCRCHPQGRTCALRAQNDPMPWILEGGQPPGKQSQRIRSPHERQGWGRAVRPMGVTSGRRDKTGHSLGPVSYTLDYPPPRMAGLKPRHLPTKRQAPTPCASLTAYVSSSPIPPGEQPAHDRSHPLLTRSHRGSQSTWQGGD